MRGLVNRGYGIGFSAVNNDMNSVHASREDWVLSQGSWENRARSIVWSLLELRRGIDLDRQFAEMLLIPLSSNSLAESLTRFPCTR